MVKQKRGQENEDTKGKLPNSEAAYLNFALI
jgi:hypothetical protein